MAASYNTDDVNHVTNEVFDSIHDDAAAPVTIDSNTSALLHPKQYYSMRTVHFLCHFVRICPLASVIIHMFVRKKAGSFQPTTCKNHNKEKN
jgi:hypothetical protein